MPFPWPGPRPGRDWLDPSAGLLAGKAIKLLELGGGPGLQEQMGGVLQEIAGGSLGG